MKSVTGNTYTFIGTKNIGSGTYGTVRPILRDDGAEYVIKLFHKECSDHNVGVLREISIMKMLKGNNCNLVEMEDIICMNDEEQTTGIVMKRYKYDLHDAIQKGGLDLEKRICIGRKLIEAVGFLHINGIIHRDIKPANILLDEEDNPVLCDFSLAKVFDGLSGDGTHTGTVVSELYRAPEVIYHKKYSYPIDIWSLGLVLYELFTMKLLSCETVDDVFSYLDNMTITNSNNIFFKILGGMVKKDQYKRLTIKQIMESNFFDKPTELARILNYTGEYKVSEIVEEMCKYLDVEKKITRMASQIYVDRTNCSIESAVELASKIYDTSHVEIDNDYYADEELLILEKMEYNLFI